MAPPNVNRGTDRAIYLLLGGLGVVILLMGVMVHHTYQQAASHHSVIHMFDSRHDGGLRRPEATLVRHDGNRNNFAHKSVGAGVGRIHHRRAGGHIGGNGDDNDTVGGGAGTGDAAHAEETSTRDVGEGRATTTTTTENLDKNLDKNSSRGEGGVDVVDGAIDSQQRQQQQPQEAPQCGGKHERRTEYWGDVVAAGDGPGARRAATSAECCARCGETAGCNVWVHCSASEGGDAGCDGQCWLKRVDDPAHPTTHAHGPGVAWTSGALLKDYDPNPGGAGSAGSAGSAGVGGDTSPRTVALVTPEGRINVLLRPDWHAESVNYVSRLAAERACGKSCHLYRAEPTFLLQGTLRSFRVAANKKTLRGPKIMERGEIGWAGGGAGPDFFIYLGDRPAAHWGHDHTVWGTVADKVSLEVAEKIVNLPSHTPGGPNTMRFLREYMYFDIEPVVSQ